MCRFTLFSFFFFINATMTIDKLANVTPLLQEPMTFWRLMAVVMATSCFVYIVFITLIPPGGFLAKKGEQDILREMHWHPYSNIFSSAQKACWFFTALTALQPLHLYSPYTLTALTAFTPLEPLRLYSPYTLTAHTPLQPLHLYSPYTLTALAALSR